MRSTRMIANSIKGKGDMKKMMKLEAANSNTLLNSQCSAGLCLMCPHFLFLDLGYRRTAEVQKHVGAILSRS